MNSAQFTSLKKMRPIENIDDSFAAAELIAQAATDDPDAFGLLVPSEATTAPVALAEDGSIALFDVYAESNWFPGDTGSPIARIAVARSFLSATPVRQARRRKAV